MNSDSELQFYLLSIIISILVAATDISLDGQFQNFKLRAVTNPWSLPIYILYGLTTWLIIVIAIDIQWIEKLSLTSAVIIGISGPGILRSKFRIIDTNQDSRFNRVFDGIREIFTDQILKSLAKKRLKKLEIIGRLSEELLTEKLGSIMAGERLDKVKEIIQKRKHSDPTTVKPFIIHTIANHSPEALDNLFQDARRKK